MAFNWNALGKKLAPCGVWAQKAGLTQKKFGEICKLNKNTVGKLFTDPEYEARPLTVAKIVVALRHAGYTVTAKDITGK